MTKPAEVGQPTVEPAQKPKSRGGRSKTAKAKKAAVENPWPDDAQAAPEAEPGSEPLHNPKQERFAQNIAGGLALHDAYREAGYKGDPSNARRLRDEDHVWLRIDWLKREIGKVVIQRTAELIVEKIAVANFTKDQAFKEADEVLRLTMALGQGGPAVRAVELKCRIAGVPLDSNPTQAPSDDENNAREAADPGMIEAFERLNGARRKLLAHVLPPEKAKKATTKEKVA